MCAQILIFTLHISVLILFVFRETCLFTPVSENIDCIYKYIYHSSLFSSFAFDIIFYLSIYHLAGQIYLLKYTEKLEKQHMLLDCMIPCHILSQIKESEEVQGCYWIYWNCPVCEQMRLQQKGADSGIIRAQRVCVAGPLYKRGGPCTEKVNNAFNRSADV